MKDNSFRDKNNIEHMMKSKIHSVPPIMKKNAEILLCYRWLFIKGDVIIGEWGIFGVEGFLHYSQFFVKGNFIIGRVECRLQKPPVLHLPDSKERFRLYSDTIKYAMGSVLYQIQNGKPKLIVYTSKRLPKAAKNYYITELEMCGLAINIVSFAHLLKKGRF